MAPLSRTASFASSHGSANPTYNAVAIGANGGNDILYIAFGGRSTASVTVVTGVTVDGVAATQIIETDSGTATGNIAAIFAIARNSLPDPTQTDVDIAITYNQSVLRTAGEMYVSPDASATATGTGTESLSGTFTTSQTLDGNVDTVLNGIVIGFCVMGATNNPDPPTATWTGATEDVDGQFAGSSSVRTSANADNVAALWAGVPIVTYAGETFPSRVAGSLLHAVGLPELVATSEEDYFAVALTLATEADLLEACKAKLQRNRLTTSLFDVAAYTLALEELYETMWERHCAGASRISISASPP
jgi:hypothetical protein